MVQRYHSKEDQKLWPSVCNHVTRILSNEKVKCLNWENVSVERITDGGLEAGPPAAGGCRRFFEKNNDFDVIESHFARP